MSRLYTSLIWSACAIIGWIVVAILVLAIFAGVYSIAVAHQILAMPVVNAAAAQSILRP